ncbi:hypothetical protein PR202_gb05529 [Eleusine coracana subsp. coracana]|uniref:Uncharacterized protein n=1 Tax=Eleusine coracana subsp. coracana TaxID=191504 RepID=A0AAV5E4R1_ELECO|nr:hypothetical protein PR202_gb05529 [Eleusine coracana subsp. coracana]
MGILVGVPAPGDDVPVVRGVDFAPDSVEGAGSEFYFIPDSGEEVSSELQVLPVVDSKIVPDSLAEDLGSKDVVVAEVDASGAKLDAAAKVGRVEVRDAKVDGPFVDLSGGTDEVADVAASACMDDVLGSEYVVNEDMETQEEWVTDLHILWVPSYAGYVYRKRK